MIEGAPVNHEKENNLGLSTLEIAQKIVGSSSSIQAVNLRPYHYVPNQPSTREISYPTLRDSFLGMKQQELEEWANSLGQEYNIALDSQVRFIDETQGHLVMTDLAPEKSPENLEKIKQQLREIIKPRFGGGYLLETNRSYHYIGEATVAQQEWYESLGRFLITSIVTKTPDGVPNIHEVIADYRYIGHSLVRSTTGLRLTARGRKKVLPFVVDWV